MVIGGATKWIRVANLDVWIYLCRPFGCCATVSRLKRVVRGTLLTNIKTTILGDLQIS